jgi:uncharacterized protein (TIGR03086 family)
LAGKDASAIRKDESLLGDDPVGAWEPLANRASEAFAAPGALDGTVAHPYVGEMPALQLLVFRIVDNVVHSWDLAVATGHDPAMRQPLVDDVYDLVAPFADLIPRGSGFASPVPVPGDASTDAKLLGLFGRDPTWGSQHRTGSAPAAEPSER